jgi:hypothetical protein
MVRPRKKQFVFLIHFGTSSDIECASPTAAEKGMIVAPQQG